MGLYHESQLWMDEWMDERPEEWTDGRRSLDLAAQRGAYRGACHYRNHEDVKKEVVRQQ
jgi:hypothetical protein